MSELNMRDFYSKEVLDSINIEENNSMTYEERLDETIKQIRESNLVILNSEDIIDKVE